jgi:hypothetical protein
LKSIYARACRDIGSGAAGGVFFQFQTGQYDDERRFFVDKETFEVTLIPQDESDYSDDVLELAMEVSRSREFEEEE